MANHQPEQRPLLDQGDAQGEDCTLSGVEAASRRSLKDLFSNPRELTHLERILGGALLGLLCLACLGFGLFTGEMYRLGKLRGELNNGGHPGGHHGGNYRTVTSTVMASPTTSFHPPTSTPQPPSRNDRLCLTPTCVRMASGILDSLDQSADPCDDFYQFSTGGWRCEHPIPPSKGLFGVAHWIGEQNSRVLHEILSKPIKKVADGDAADERNLRTLKAFFDACTDEGSLDAIGAKPLKEILERVVKLWRGTSAPGFVVQRNSRGNRPGGKAESPRREAMTRTLSYLHARAIPALFSSSLEGDVVADPNFMRIWVGQSGLGFAKSYYSDAGARAVYLDTVTEALGSIYAMVGLNIDAKESARKVLDFETKLAKVSADPEDLNDPAKTYHLMEVEEVEDLFPLLNWRDYYASYSPRPSFPDPLIVNSKKYLKKASKIVKQASDQTLEAYFLWCVTREFAPLLSATQASRKAVERLGNYLTGVDEGTKPERSQVCLDALLENLGILAGRYFVRETFSGESKAYAENVIKATIKAFGDNLSELDWIDAKSRAAAKEKAEAIRIKIGFPISPNVSDPTALERYYSLNAIRKGDYFGNVLRSRIADQRRLFSKVGASRNVEQWEMIPSEVNAYYNPPSNEIVFPAGFLQPPYFSKDWPEYLVFGAFGSAAGHELSHAFDQSGRQYDKDGRLTNWWTNSTTHNFENLTQCFLQQYANYTITDPQGREIPINSKLTLGEDMADAGGVAQSFAAWQKRYSSDPDGKKYENYLLPGLDFTREQLFWLAYGRGWAQNMKASEAVNRIYTDPHSPTKYRVIGVVSNDPNFQKAFGCKRGDTMHRDRVCKIW